MPFSYNPLWKLLIDKNMSRRELARQLNLSTSTLTHMGRGDYISLKVLDKICTALHCTPNDIMEHVPPREEPPGKDA